MLGSVILSLAWTVLLIALPIIAISRSGRDRKAIARLSDSLDAVRDRLMQLEQDREPPRPHAAAPSPSPGEAAAVPPAEEPAPTEPEPAAAGDAKWQPASPAPASRPASAWSSAERRRRLEESLTSRWMVWLGAAAIALGGAFLVKYSVEQGWLGPAARTTIAFLFGAALAFGGEWLRRRPLQRAIASVRPDQVPPALTAGGLFTCFASVYAAYALYGFLSPLAAFALLACVAAAAIGLALLQGWLIALIGLVGGFVTPVLVQTETPSAWALFPYLIVIEIACLIVARYMVWWWYVMAMLAGAAVWPLIWFVTAWKPADVYPLGGYLLILAALVLGFRHITGPLFPARTDATLATRLGRTGADLNTGIACAVIAVLVFALVRMADYDAASLAVVGAVSLLYLFVAYRDSAVDFLAPLAAALTICAMAVWHLPNIVLRTDFFPSLVPVVPPELVPFLSVETAFGALFGAGGFLALRRTPRPALWAGLSACAPVVLFTVAYWRIVDFGLNIRWAFVALALAAVSVAAAASVAGERGLRTALGYYAAATVAFISLGMTMTLQEAWLSVALSIQLPALGWIARRVPGRELRWIAGIVAALVLARLVLNPDVLHYQFGPSPALGWVLYGYGLPALAFWWAARLFRGAGDDALVTMLDAGALAFVVLFLSFEIRAIVAGSLASRHYSLAEQSLHTIAWLSVAYVLRLRDRVARHRVAYWGGRLLVGAAAVQVVGLQLLFSSPLSAHVYWVATGPNSFTPMRLHEAVGAYPVVNLLFLAYAVPAIYFAWFADDFRRQAKPWFAHAFSALSFVLAFAYISLEVRRAFQGPVLGATHTSDAEFYTLSAAWLLYALALLGLGIWLKRSALRYASLVVLLLAILKVFLFDMAGLQGLYRALSFLGLGLCLVAIGYVYQRFVFPRPGRPASAEAPTG